MESCGHNFRMKGTVKSDTADKILKENSLQHKQTGFFFSSSSSSIFFFFFLTDLQIARTCNSVPGREKISLTDETGSIQDDSGGTTLIAFPYQNVRWDLEPCGTHPHLSPTPDLGRWALLDLAALAQSYISLQQGSSWRIDSGRNAVLVVRRSPGTMLTLQRERTARSLLCIRFVWKGPESWNHQLDSR